MTSSTGRRLPFSALARVLTALLLVAWPARAAQEERQPPPPVGVPDAAAHLLRIDGPLDRGGQSHLRRAIDAARAGSGVLIVDLDTPGGEVELMWQMARTLQEASDAGVLTAVWVDERALSAGALLAMASDRLIMRAQARIGSALPVRIGPTGLAPVSEDESVVEKMLSEFRTEFRTIAVSRNRPGALAEAMVDPGVEVLEIEEDGASRLVSAGELSDLRGRGIQPTVLRTVVHEGRLLNLSGAEAFELGLADGLAEDLDEVASLLSVPRAGIVVVERARSEELAGALYTWTPILLVLAFVLAYVELKIPGFGVAGILSIACFAVVLLGRYLVGMADVPHVVLLVVGFGLLAAELFLVPGTIWLGALGVLCLLGGLVWSFAGLETGFAHALDRRILLRETLRVIGAALVAMIATWTLSRFLPQTPFFGRLVLDAGRGRAPHEAGHRAGAMPEAGGAHARVARVGARGRALTALRPVGKVALDEQPELEFEARSSGPQLARGAAVVVVEAQHSGRLVVEPAGEHDGEASA